LVIIQNISHKKATLVLKCRKNTQHLGWLQGQLSPLLYNIVESVVQFLRYANIQQVIEPTKYIFKNYFYIGLPFLIEWLFALTSANVKQNF
jgi:hypothetical protein